MPLVLSVEGSSIGISFSPMVVPPLIWLWNAFSTYVNKQTELLPYTVKVNTPSFQMLQNIFFSSVVNIHIIFYLINWFVWLIFFSRTWSDWYINSLLYDEALSYDCTWMHCLAENLSSWMCHRSSTNLGWKVANISHATFHKKQLIN